MVLAKLLTFLSSIIIGVTIIRNREQIVKMVGKAEWAERYLGAGGTYTMWILIALGIIFLALSWMIGTPFDNAVVPVE